MRRALLICLVLCGVAGVSRAGTEANTDASTEVEELIGNLEASQKAANQRASQELVAFMSLKTMFPDSEVRALAKAAGKGRIRTIDKWVAQGVDVNARGTRGATPLFWAMRNAKGFERLLEWGADPNVVYEDGGSIMHWAIRHRKDVYLKLVLEHGGDPNMVVGVQEETPLYWALGYSEKHKVPMLLEAGANINSQRRNGETPLMDAAMMGQYDLVLDLLERGADYTIKDKRGKGLADTIAFRRPTMDPKNDLTDWMLKVIAWLEGRGVTIPESRKLG
jgi:ankyrin repeat protein